MVTSQVDSAPGVVLSNGPDKVFQTELHSLRSEVWELGRTIETAVVESIEVLRQRASGRSESLITLEHEISKKRFAVEMDCLSLIAVHQPDNGDLRAITSVLEIVTELEHIGKYITDVASIHFLVVKVDQSLLEPLDDIRRMAIRTQDMIHRALEALLQQDVALARAVHRDDKEVDAFYRQIYLNLLEFMGDRSRTTVRQARYLARIARNLERTADRVTNICEWVIFCVTGKMNGMELEGE